ncbi:MAG TPA: DUF87 domain-containing protein [Candidatus Paceibacterota bacterium]|nr:DUF87 domain-containing protein [Candidatus Paceibacterota bacterium]
MEMAELDIVTYFALTDARNKRIKFGIKAKDRTKHVYVIGKTGMGKSTVLENMAVQDIQSGNGFAFIDPHGKTAELLLEYIPESRIKDVLYIAPFDTDFPVSFNVMEDVGADKRHLVVNGLMSAFKKIWVDAWSARMEYILNNILLALLESPGSTLIGVNRMLADKDYRKEVVANVNDPSVKAFWVDEFAKYGERYMQEAGAAIQNKIGQFISNPIVRNIIGQPKSTFDLRTLMDQKKIVIINLSKGRVGEQNANLLGSMLITKIYLGAMSRADVSERVLNTLPQFYLYVDEFQSFANESFADILSEARKYKLNLTMAHQYIEQMSDEVRAAVFGNVGTMIVFRVGAYDAEVLEKEFAPTFEMDDIVNLGIYQIYLKLMIDGVTSQPFSATTMPPIERQAVSFRDQIIESSRATYAHTRAEVEGHVRKQAGSDKRDAAMAPKPPQVSAPPTPQNRPAPISSAPRPYQNDRPAPQRFDREPRREPQRPTPVVPAPIPKLPIEPSDGFSSLADIGKKIVQTEEKVVARAEEMLHIKPRQNAPQQVPPKKAGTEAAKADLRAVLSQAMKQTQNQQSTTNNTQPQTPISKSSALVEDKKSLPADGKEVPADVLKKILEVNE